MGIVSEEEYDFMVVGEGGNFYDGAISPSSKWF